MLYNLIRWQEITAPVLSPKSELTDTFDLRIGSTFSFELAMYSDCFEPVSQKEHQRICVENTKKFCEEKGVSYRKFKKTF